MNLMANDVMMLESLKISELRMFETAGIIPTLLALSIKDEATFTEIKNMTGVGNGSLHRALKKLEERGLITVNAKIINDKPVKVFRLTEDGRDLARHLKGLLEYFEKREEAKKLSKLDAFI